MVVRQPDKSRAIALAPAKVQAVARLLLFLSGATALAFQTLWVKQLTLVVGVEVLAVSVGVAAFFAGLAAGAAALGTRVDRAPRPLRWYASLEALVAILGTVTTLLMPSAPAAFVMLQSRVGWLAWLLPGLLVAIPAFFMGGTLPAATRWLQPMDRALGRDVGALYAWNTSGAILGALLAPFVLVPWLGVRGAGLAAALACLGIAAVAMAIERGRVGGGVTGTHDRTVAAAGSVAPRVMLGLALYACAGGIAMGYEVLWSQIVAPFTSTRGAAFALVLAVYLAGLALGSGIWARVADRIADRWAAFGFLIALSGLLAVLSATLLGSLVGREIHALSITARTPAEHSAASA